MAKEKAFALAEAERVKKEKEEIDERNRTLQAEAERLKQTKERVVCEFNKEHPRRYFPFCSF